jgi:hypothetical protein
MSQENVEIVRAIYEEWERGEFGRVEWADPEIEFVMTDGPSPGSWTGIAAMTEVWRDAMSSFTGLRAVAEQYRVLDDGQILVLTSNTGRGKVSGLELGEMRTRGANLFRVKEGKVTALILYWEAARALADLGLKE